MIQFYKPNSENTGTAFGFRLGTKGQAETEPCVFMTAIKQHSWNAKTKTGSFSENAKDPEKAISIKFNENELGGFIYAIQNYQEFKAFHTYEENTTQISLKPYTKKNGDKAFSFTVTRNSTQKFGMGVELAEAQVLSEYLKFALVKIFEFRIAQKK